MDGDRRQEGVFKRLLVVVGTVLWTDGCLGYFLAPALLLSPLDKVTVSAVNFPEPSELLESEFFLSLYKDFRGVKIIFANYLSGWGISMRQGEFA